MENVDLYIQLNLVIDGQRAMALVVARRRLRYQRSLYASATESTRVRVALPKKRTITGGSPSRAKVAEPGDTNSYTRSLRWPWIIPSPPYDGDTKNDLAPAGSNTATNPPTMLSILPPDPDPSKSRITPARPTRCTLMIDVGLTGLGICTRNNHGSSTKYGHDVFEMTPIRSSCLHDQARGGGKQSQIPLYKAVSEKKRVSVATKPAAVLVSFQACGAAVFFMQRRVNCRSRTLSDS
ncbi:hypothetical protein P691DRAFT_782530 [Macrolepiota fuliginosa MF-IS2]|uniref:Uncharacterized protein n=1 Tax=Macrolepiota fuliginosa MF-IS2 TaxID=1400762 RepID=A0A9P6BUN0_9AGAR|nr:hypothetical protein P691DRAFT_782530 [Macrolepiota fuliginosa MF-IS2]